MSVVALVSRAGMVTLLIVVVVAGVLAVVAPAVPALPRQLEPEPCEGRRSTEQRPCVGPVTDESGGGGDALTIARSATIGLAIAGGAFLLVRRQLARSTGRP